MILLIYNNENELSNATNKVQELLEKAIEKKQRYGLLQLIDHLGNR